VVDVAVEVVVVVVVVVAVVIDVVVEVGAPRVPGDASPPPPAA
jgi:hypothetical protein